MSDLLVIDAPEDDPYTMANLRPDRTGLPMVVWVSERGNAKHDVRVKVCRVHGSALQSNYNNTASVGVRPRPALAAGQLSTDDLQAVISWINLNADPIVAFWDGLIDTFELLQRLRPLDPPIPP